jgi:hypothetical protein
LNFKGEQTGSRIQQTKKGQRILRQGITVLYPVVAEIVNISQRQESYGVLAIHAHFCEATAATCDMYSLWGDS